jgi:hypothetical protein
MGYASGQMGICFVGDAAIRCLAARATIGMISVLVKPQASIHPGATLTPNPCTLYSRRTGSNHELVATQIMAETLGSLCDKLTIVKLKQWHSSDDAGRMRSLDEQERSLRQEIDEFVGQAVTGDIPQHRLTFAANKIYKKEGNVPDPVMGTLGALVAELATVNCDLWHEQEKVYDFEKVGPEDKNKVVRQLARLNLRRNECIDSIDRTFRDAVAKNGGR